MEWVIIAFGLLYVASIIWNIHTNDKEFRFYSAFLLTASVIMLVALFSSYENRNTPTALNVYQGKTTLEITYRDNIPVDSVVVFKKKIKL